ncbi:kinase-like protein [Trichoderma citrinoviride]|uniref:non-specific serine/threonine protein kinase n=1 Tax=Trichoderma citrinoviride TaxID=58853 RepID=A0A2T4B605_9HYPO|nr:kinase-like protein [Trichoderma citrinoviride]PTB64730.1 kinase-like protein [Trichoderma citrinoviride]
MSTEDKYETLEKIGHGSFGIIRKVRRKADGFIMCRKEISYLRMTQKEREQLHSEFQILSHLRHPNIVAYYHREHLKASQDLHLYMEYCGNGDLGRVIKELQMKGQRAQESFVWSIFSQLVLALYRCHYGIDPPDVGGNVLGAAERTAPKTPAGAVTILHRDLKPENVFLGEDNSVKLGDFGLSKMIKSQDFASTYVGTPFYMSPEICAAEKYTLKSDIWSLGCIIYELCAREPPFNAKTHFQLIQKIKEGRVAPLPEMYSPELNQVIKDCLKVNPDRRPDTAQLVHLPVVRLMRKEKEVVDLNRALKAREEILREKETELNQRLVNLDKDKHLMRQELDASVRREWEVKARLEIDRQVSAEVERLKKQFEEEVRNRVEKELESRRKRTPPPPVEEVQIDSPMTKSDQAHNSSADGSGDEFPSTTDITELSYSAESPDFITKDLKRAARTPFHRAQTMFAGQMGTPMDIEMQSPSPMAIASLSLSPRRQGKTLTHQGNIFAANSAPKAAANPDDWARDGLESDGEDACPPSPTQHRASIKNPFTSKNRPLLSQKSASAAARIRNATTTSSGFVSKAAIPPNAQAGSRKRSPVGRLTKIPSIANMTQPTTVNEANTPSPISSSSSSSGLSRRLSARKEAADSTGRIAKSNFKGYTLIELNQARAGGRPTSITGMPLGENVGPKRSGTAAYRERVASSSYGPVAVWDPDTDEMPSPFLDRRRIARV